jgi:hypothetical protein
MAVIKIISSVMLFASAFGVISCNRIAEAPYPPRLKTVGASVASPTPGQKPMPSPVLPIPTTIKLVKDDKNNGRQGELGRYKQYSPFIQNQTTPVILPEDFILGKTESFNEPNPVKKEILDVLRKFMDKFIKGEVAEDLINKDDLIRVGYSLKAAISDKTLPVKYRVGAIPDSSELSMAVRIRFWGSKNSVEGDIYLVQSNGKWLITDVIAEFSRLESVSAGNQEKFVPLGYKVEY